MEISAIGDVTKPGPSATRSEPGGRRPSGSATRVLAVDDEPGLAGLVASRWHEGWDVETAADERSTVRAGREFRPDAVVLDAMLPDFGGLEVLRRLRAEPPAVCVLFLTAQESVEDRIAGITAPGLAVRQEPGRMFIRKKLRSCGNPYTTGATSAFLPRSRFRSSGWPDRHEC